MSPNAEGKWFWGLTESALQTRMANANSLKLETASCVYGTKEQKCLEKRQTKEMHASGETGQRLASEVLGSFELSEEGKPLLASVRSSQWAFSLEMEIQ